MSVRKSDYDKLPEIPYGSHPKVLLVGNGITLSFDGAKDVDEIIRKEWKKNYASDLPKRNDKLVFHAIWNQPLPMQVVIATKDKVDSCMEELAEEFKSSTVEPKQKDLVENILRAKFDAILSTNYSLEIERSVMPGASDRKIQTYYRTTTKQTNQQMQFGIFQSTELPYANNPTLWHIHGTAFRKNSMVMGQYYYGKLLSEVVDRANKVMKKYNYSVSHKMSYLPESWVDYFLIGDVHCFGLSMALSEADIWWLLSFKKSAFKDSSFTLYERDKIEGIKSLLFDSYGVNVPDLSAKAGKNYIEFYNNVCDMLR